MRWAIPAAVLTVVLVLSLWTDVSLGSERREFLAHAAAYGAVAASLLAARRRSTGAIGWSTGGAVGIGLFLLGVGLAVEVSQLWVVGRETDPVDVLADASGIGIALGIWFLIRSWRRARSARRRSAQQPARPRERAPTPTTPRSPGSFPAPFPPAPRPRR